MMPSRRGRKRMETVPTSEEAILPPTTTSPDGPATATTTTTSTGTTSVLQSPISSPSARSASSSNSSILLLEAATIRQKHRWGPCCWRMYHFCNTFAVTLLTVAVGFLFIQLQVLRNALVRDEKVIAELEEKVKTQQVSQHELNQQVEKEHSFTLFQMAGTFALLTCLITMFHMTQHLSAYHEPAIQRKIIAILWMSPIYSITSWLSLVFLPAHGYLAILKDFYEAYVIYTFLSFLIAVLGRGDRIVAVDVLAKHADHLSTPSRLLQCFYHPPPNESANAKANAVLLECQIWAMQFVLIRPFTSIIRFIVETLMIENYGYDESDDNWIYFKSPMFAVDMVTNISVAFAFHGLLKFYHTVHHDLEWCQPFNKFMSIKGIVFLTFWQGLMISILVSLNYESNDATSGGGRRRLPGEELFDNLDILKNSISNMTDTALDYVEEAADENFYNGTIVDIYNSSNNNNNNDTSTFIMDDGNNMTSSSPFGSEGGNGGDDDDTRSAREQAAMIQNFLICLEMLFFSIAHWCVFPAEEWEPDYRPKEYAKPGIGLKDFASDISYIVSSSTSARKYKKQKRKQLKKQQQQQQADSNVASSSSECERHDSSDSEEGPSFHNEEDDDDDDDDEEQQQQQQQQQQQKENSSAIEFGLHRSVQHRRQHVVEDNGNNLTTPLSPVQESHHDEAVLCTQKLPSLS